MEPECSLPHSQHPATCPYPQPNQSSPCLPIPSWRSIIILSSHLLLGLASGLFPSGLLTTTLYAPLLFLIRATCSAHRNDFYLITQIISRDQYRSWCSSLCSLLHCRVISFLLGPKCLPQHPIVQFLPQCERPSFIPIQNNRQNYISYILIVINTTH